MEQPSRVGKYEIEQYLGGGMSHVYRARDSVLGRRVALKILTEEGAADAESKARFLLEARTASNISHENIISVYDFGEDKGRPFIVMELLEGQSLREAIRAGHAGDFTRRMKIALQVARAVDYIHTQKIIHRDIKPENIHVDPAGRVKLMDFGIAKAEGMALTRHGFTLGTPYYMAPEQVLGQPLTAQADVYSFGVLLFELLTGAKPVNGATVEAIFHQILYDPVNLAPVRALHLPPAVGELIGRCMAKPPAQRPQGLGSVCDSIEEIIDSSRADSSRAPKPPPRSAERLGSAAVPPRTAEAQRVLPAAPNRSGTFWRGMFWRGMFWHGKELWASPAEEVPAFFEKLPPPLRTPAGLMLLAGVIALVGLMLVYAILARLFE